MGSNHLVPLILLSMFGAIFLFTISLIVILLVANIFRRYGRKLKKKDHLRLVR